MDRLPTLLDLTLLEWQLSAALVKLDRAGQLIANSDAFVPGLETSQNPRTIAILEYLSRQAKYASCGWPDGVFSRMTLLASERNRKRTNELSASSARRGRSKEERDQSMAYSGSSIDKIEHA